MAEDRISNDELMQFKNIPFSKKVDCMELYLLGDGQYRYNMEDVGRKILNDKNGSFTVSLIHRCYNFSGKNSRKYREGCKFEQTYGYRVTRRDIEDFVRTYPNGTFQTGITFEDFLKTRIGRAPQNTAESDSEYWASDELDLSDYSSKKSSSNDDEDALGAGLLVIISIIVLIILFRTGGLFKHWIISLICVIMLVGVFCDK